MSIDTWLYLVPVARAIELIYMYDLELGQRARRSVPTECVKISSDASKTAPKPS